MSQQRKSGKAILSKNPFTLTKADLVEKVHGKVTSSKKEAYDLVNSVFEDLKSSLIRESKVKISGFGSFTVNRKKERIGRNPQTGEAIKIAARKVLTFQPSQALKKALNSKKS